MKITKLFKIFVSKPKITHFSLIKFSLLLAIIIVALGFRLLPLRWGAYLNEYDPYFHYYNTKYIADNGLSSFFSWHDLSGWWPYGRYMPSFVNLGLSLTAVTLYRVLSIFGASLVFNPNPLDPLLADPLFNLCIIFPVLTTIMTCITMYFLGRSIGGEFVGLLSALLLALDPSYIGRTSLGWFDDETIGILSALLAFLFFSKAIDSNKAIKDGIIYSILAGLSLGYICISWGAARYIISVMLLFTIVLLFLRKYTPRLLLSYMLTFSIALTVAASSPRLGLGFLLESFTLLIYGVLILLLMVEVLRREKSGKKRAVYALIFFIIVVAAFSSLAITGVLREPSRKFIYAIFPQWRSESPLFESVAEHKPSGWAVFFNNFGIGLIFVPLGVFLAVSSATNLGILTVLYCLTSLYFASSMIRLLILASPAICLLWALAIKKISLPFLLSLRGSALPLKHKVKIRFFSRGLVGGLLTLFFISFLLVYIFGTTFLGSTSIFYADSPTVISGASLSNVKPSSIVRDWIDSLVWMRNNFPPSPSKPGEIGTVIACWWDYGYWITVFANKTTLADNGTFNGTQIRQIAKMFMSNETEAIEMLKQYGATHVVVFTTFRLDVAQYYGSEYALYEGSRYGGDNGKWVWMARIAGFDETTFGNFTLGWDWVGRAIPNSLGQNTTLYKLMMYGIETTVFGYSSINLTHFRKAYFSREYPVSSIPETGNVVPLVCIYEIIYN
ncbi:MAG: STT3 domain-containing protein [Candidatus Bathyarchaeia archaeon]